MVAESCPRCGAGLHSRKPESLRRTWALVIAAALLYIPANTLPVMRVVSMGQEQSDTILGGIRFFLHSGSWPLALLIFLASVVVPLLKLAILSFLALSIRRRSRWKPRFRTRLYRLTELIGRWSMVDIYVVTLMVALVEMGALATIEPAPGALVFALVVVTTMLASHSFDPRLIWDALEPGHE
jgi:paraquat-inducible protein A